MNYFIINSKYLTILLQQVLGGKHVRVNKFNSFQLS